ncbi:hypothetical protein Hypma_006356 [Hypsizygus marmoreus]|uniref:Carboxylesterase type B domain-containing protein n=1 Tax=Hypsizygus marmoreus TaxID=39966 RepID=A0A369JYN1_HYPMA|nr:hypothetical protein Hypma_006356 [Hypsizygus marmoreus]
MVTEKGSRHFFLTVALALLAIEGSFAASTESRSLTVDHKPGTFRGVLTSSGIQKWLGIPYALPPTGARRFKAPVPIHRRSPGVVDVSAFGHACTQASAELGAPTSEDCLVLNI